MHTKLASHPSIHLALYCNSSLSYYLLNYLWIIWWIKKRKAETKSTKKETIKQEKKQTAEMSIHLESWSLGQKQNNLSSVDQELKQKHLPTKTD